jgi:hypothetical protein
VAAAGCTSALRRIRNSPHNFSVLHFKLLLRQLEQLHHTTQKDSTQLW